MFLPSREGSKLYLNRNDGGFQDFTESSGDLATVGEPGIAGAFGDVDGDGSLDLFVSQPEGRSRLYLGDGKGAFQDITQRAGLPDMAATGACFADLDGDGDLDLAANLSDRAVVFRNDSTPLPDRAWLSVRLATRKGATGAVVRVEDSAGVALGMRELPELPLASFTLPTGGFRVSAVTTDGGLSRESAELRPPAAALTIGK